MNDASAMKSDISIFHCINIMLWTTEAGRHISVFNMLLQEDQCFWQAEEYRGAGAGEDAAVAAGGYGAAEEEWGVSKSSYCWSRWALAELQIEAVLGSAGEHCIQLYKYL